MSIEKKITQRVIRRAQRVRSKINSDCSKLRVSVFRSLTNIYAQINQLEPIKSAEITIRPITPFYPWSLGLALILSFILILIKLRRS